VAVEKDLEVTRNDPELASHIDGAQLTVLDPVPHRRFADLCQIGHFTDGQELAREHVCCASSMLSVREANPALLDAD
jgi:hypothetical protein